MARLARPAPSLTVRILLAFLAVYVIWGSTYLAIRFAIETLPPLLMGGIRFLVAGTLVYGWMRLRGHPRPTWAQWRACAIVGLLLLVGGNGMVILGEQFVPSSVAALLVAMTPIWMALLLWLRPRGVRPTWQVAGGLLLGFLGVVLLMTLGGRQEHGGWQPAAGLLVVAASLSWAIGSLYARTAPMPRAPLLGSGMEMLAGGAVLTVLGTIHGEWSTVHLAQISARSALALVYLILFGSIVGFSAYVWLLRVTTPARVSTYAYVNPVVAVFLGWSLAGEPVTSGMLMAAALIVLAVAAITLSPQRTAAAPTTSATEAAPPRAAAPNTEADAALSGSHQRS